MGLFFQHKLAHAPLLDLSRDIHLCESQLSVMFTEIAAP